MGHQPALGLGQLEIGIVFGIWQAPGVAQSGNLQVIVDVEPPCLVAAFPDTLLSFTQMVAQLPCGATGAIVSGFRVMVKTMA